MPGRPAAQAVDALEERLDVGVAEAALARLRRHVGSVAPAVAVISGGQQHDLDPGLLRRLRHGDRHRVRLRVGRAVGLVVDVVELTDGAVAGVHHLGVDGQRDRVHRVGIELGDRVEHRLAPAPEVVGRRGRADALGGAAHVALERVRVDVDHRRDLRPRCAAHRAAPPQSARRDPGAPRQGARR